MQMNYEEICWLITGLKKKMRVDNTCYSNFLVNQSIYNDCMWDNVVCEDKTIVATYHHMNDKKRKLIYFSYDIAQLKQLLRNVSDDILVEFICRGKNPIHQVFLESGFTCLGPLVRKSVNFDKSGKEYKCAFKEKLEPYYNPDFGKYAETSDAEEIHSLLESVFDDRIDDIPSVEQLKEYIAKQWVLLYRKEHKIRTLYIYQIKGKRFFSNYSYNTLPAIALYCLERRAHDYVVNNYDVKIKYSWINVKNNKSLRRNVSDVDDVYKYVYVKEKENYTL